MEAMEDATSTEAKLSSILLKKPLARDETPWLGGFFREALRMALEGHDPLPKSRILNLLANASREAEWREIFGYCGILETCAVLLPLQQDQEVIKHSMRLIGNCCADTDANRDIIIRLGVRETLLHLAGTKSTYDIGNVVLFNFANGYEPAQMHLSSQRMITLLSSILSDGTPGPTAVEYGLKCLELTLSSDQEEIGAPPELLTQLVTLAMNPETPPDDFLTLLAILTMLMRDETNQTRWVEAGNMDIYISLLVKTKGDLTNALNGSVENGEADVDDSVSLLRRYMGLLTTSVCDMTALDCFLRLYAIDSPFVGTMFDWARTEDADLVTCATLVIGNLARDSPRCKALIQNFSAHEVLATILKSETQIGILHAVGGALKNIAICGTEFKELVAGTGVLPSCSKFYSAKVLIQVQQMGLSLVRVLVTDSPKNVQKLLSPSPESEIHCMTDLLDLYESMSELPIRIEIGRIVVSIIRELNRDTGDPTIQNLSAKLFTFAQWRIIEPLLYITTQEAWPVVASEGWFALALVSKLPQGSDLIASFILPDAFYMSLKRTVGLSEEEEFGVGDKAADIIDPNHEPRPRQSDQVERDKSNAMVFLAEFIKNVAPEKSSETAITLRQIFESCNKSD